MTVVGSVPRLAGNSLKKNPKVESISVNVTLIEIQSLTLAFVLNPRNFRQV